MSGRCPFCAGTDLAHTTGSKTICLDCEKTWGGKTPRVVREPRVPSDGAIAAMVRDMGSRG